MMMFDEAGRLAKNCGINLSHECDEDAAECNCSEEQLAEDGIEIGKHDPGDSRCENRSAHTACSHDIERLTHLYYYWVAASSDDNTGVGDTGYIEAESAQDAAEMYARELGEIEDCAGQVVRTRPATERNDLAADYGEAIA